MYNETQPSRYKREKQAQRRDRRDALLTLGFIALVVAIFIVEYSGLADSLLK